MQKEQEVIPGMGWRAARGPLCGGHVGSEAVLVGFESEPHCEWS